MSISTSSQRTRMLAVALVTLWCAAPVFAQRLIWLGPLPGGTRSWAHSVSLDGSTVVGGALDASGYMRAFRWTPFGGMQDIGTLGGNWSDAWDVSADGSVVVGESESSSGSPRAFRWTGLSGMQELGTLGGNGSRAFGVSADGSVVVGDSFNAFGYLRAFRWTSSSGMQDLGTLGGDEAVAHGVSADGNVVVGGSATEGAALYRAFRWTPFSGMQNLGTLPSEGNTIAHSVSADGGTVTGTAVVPPWFMRAFRWTQSEGMQDLGTLGGYESYAHDVSADGSIVVGEAQDSGGAWLAFRWTQQLGMENLNTTYASLLPRGSYLLSAEGISSDGRYIVGRGMMPDGAVIAFLLDTQATFAISGNLQLRDYTGDPSLVPITVQLRQNGVAVRTETIYTDANGNYTISNVQTGTYDIAFKASHWLRVVVREVMVTSDITGVDVALTNGDIDGDNEVTLFDFGQLVAAFGSVPGDANWNPNADLDGDEEVTLFDFGVLVRNFGAVGDE